MIHPEDYENLVQLFKDTADSGRKNIFEVRVITLDNGFFWAAGIVERTLDENGNPVLISAFHDITDEKLAEEAAEREKLQERLTLVGSYIQCLPGDYQSESDQGFAVNFIYVKPGLMLELGNQESYSQLYEYVAASIHPEHLEEFCRRFSAENLNKTLDRKNEVFLDVEQMLGDGRYHWVSMQIIHVDNLFRG